MARYINADLEILKIFNTIQEKHEKNESDKFTDEILLIFVNALKTVPAADVQEVKHGKWVHDTGIWSNFEMCSLCKRWTKSSMEYDYCPNCGAKMDLKGEKKE